MPVTKLLIKLFPVLVVILSVLLILPYFHAGYFPTHDGQWAVVRLADMFRSLRDGQFPVRYSGFLNHTYGYPLFNFTYPFPYYLGTLLHSLGLGFIGSIKVIFAGSVVISGLGMYFLSRELWKSHWAALFSAVLYLFLPYRIVDLYVRGSIGEIVALAIAPLLLLFCLRQEKKFTILNFSIISVLYAALITAHNIMAVYFSLVLAAYALTLLLSRKLKPLLILIGSLVLGIGLSAFFLIPAIVEKALISLSVIPIADRSLYFLQPLDLILPKWGYGVPDSAGGFGYQLGWPQTVVFILLVITMVFNWRKKNIITIVFLAIAIGFIALLFPWSAPIWKNVPLLSEINYPWTLLAPLGFLVALISGWLWQFSKLKYVFAGLALTAVIFVVPHANPQSYLGYDDNHYLTNDATTTSSDELMPVWVKTKPAALPAGKVTVIANAGTIDNVSVNSKEINFRANLKSSALVWVNTIYYPGWQATVNGENAPISYQNDQGIMTLNLPAGPSEVNLKFEETPLRKTADVISLVSLLLLGGIYLTSVVLGSKSSTV